MRKVLIKLFWKRCLEDDEKILWTGSENRAFGLSKLPYWCPLVLTTVFSLIIANDYRYLELRNIFLGTGMFFFGACAFLNLMFFSGISYYAVTDRKIMEMCLLKVTEIRYSDIRYIGAGGMAGRLMEINRLNEKMREAYIAKYNPQAEETEPLPQEIPDIKAVPNSFLIESEESQINIVLKDSGRVKQIIENYVKPEQYGW